MANFVFYPTLTEELLNDAGIEALEYTFFYDDEGERYKLSSQYDDGDYILLDDRGLWNDVDYNLIVQTHINITNPYKLFGKNGIAPSNSTIGVSLRWSSKSANKRDTIKKVDFCKNDSLINEDIVVKIAKDRLRDSMKVSLVFSITQEGEVYENESFLACQSGMALGEINEANIMLEGKGSEFPICASSMGESNPLWTVEYNVSDPFEDKFDLSNIKIILNTDHINYSDIKEDEVENTSPLFKEIFSSALAIIIINLQNDDMLSSIRDGDDFEEGSVADAINYFIRTFNIDTTDIISIMNTIKKNVDRNL